MAGWTLDPEYHICTSNMLHSLGGPAVRPVENASPTPLYPFLQRGISLSAKLKLHSISCASLQVDQCLGFMTSKYTNTVADGVSAVSNFKEGSIAKLEAEKARCVNVMCFVRAGSHVEWPVPGLSDRDHSAQSCLNSV